MSKLVAFAAIQGAYNIVSKAEGTLKKAIEKYGPDQKIEFPNTAYYLPIIYSILGIPVKTLGEAKKPMEVARKLLPAHVKNMIHLPYLGPLLDAGMATLFAEEVSEVIRYLEDPNFYLVSEDIDEALGQDLAGRGRRYGLPETGRGVRGRHRPGLCGHCRRRPGSRKPPS